jgi:xanthine dehydrogenase iron-sulfur cluster and FAD-binding subunit A
MNEMTNSHILVHGFEYLEPGSLEEAISLLREHGDRAQVLAGGTYLLVQIKMERIAPEYVINVGKVPGLEGIAPQDGGLRVGALTKIRAIRNAPQVQAGYAALAEACAAFGSTQIQMMGTIGGNLCNGSPASDTVPALMALDARLVLAGPDGERVLPVEEFLLGPGQTALREGELLVAVQLPPLPQPLPSEGRGERAGGAGSAFIKISRVAADLAKASVAAVLVREGDRVVDCRLAFGSVGPTVSRTRGAEEVLAGRPFSAELALEAGRVASEEISPIDDVRSTAWYRREVVKALAHDVLQVAWERAGEQEAGGRKQEAGSEKQEAGSEKQEAGSEKQEAGSEKQEAGSGVLRNTQYATRNTLRVGPAETHVINLTVNGVRHTLSVAPNELLLNVLRERLELTGTKYGCGIGECGACTVHLDGKPALSCLVLAVAADGSEVLTVEGLARPDGELDPLQEAFIEHNAFQCGYCTPGMLMMTRSLLGEIPSPTEDDVRDYLKGNRCRCTGFASIVRAVMHCRPLGFSETPRVLDDENGGTHAT